VPIRAWKTANLVGHRGISPTGLFDLMTHEGRQKKLSDTKRDFFNFFFFGGAQSGNGVLSLSYLGYWMIGMYWAGGYNCFIYYSGAHCSGSCMESQL